jgi:hypothetical protein
MPRKQKEKDNWIDIVVNIVKTAQVVDIDNIIIEPDNIRAIDDAKTVVLFQNEDVPSLSVGSLGMNRIGTFMQRYNIIKSQNNPEFQAIRDEDKGYVRSIVMKSDNTKVEYRCANPDTIQAPRKINDVPKYRLRIPSSSGSLMKNAQAAMSSEIVEISSDEDGVFFRCLDINNDEFKHKISDMAIDIEDEDADVAFSHKYPLKNILATMDSHSDSMFEVGEKGIITTFINGLNILILPQV